MGVPLTGVASGASTGAAAGSIIPGIGTGIGAVVGGLTGLVGGWLQNRREKKMWKMNNQYNSPVEQMARLKEAGLNPNLVYGNGSVTGNTSSAPQAHRLPTEQLNPLQVLSAYQNLRLQSAQADIARNNADFAKIKTIAEIDKTQSSTRNSRIDALLKEWIATNPDSLSSDARNSPYMRSYQANVRAKEIDAMTRKLMYDALKKFGPNARWMLPLFVDVAKKAL